MGGGKSKTLEDASDTENNDTHIYNVDVKGNQLPIVYSDEYNITFGGLQKLHPFDSEKWGRIAGYLKEAGMMSEDDFVKPLEPSTKDLLVVHTKEYLKSLQRSWTVAMITEVPPVSLVPNSIVQRHLLQRLRLQTGGTILGAKLAIENGWSINIGGGFHHCSGSSGGGFCAYADISLAIKFMFRNFPHIKTAMIIDLDAHQGNGHERDFKDDDRVYILDAYNNHIYPGDTAAKRGINREVKLKFNTGDELYNSLIKSNIEAALAEFKPDFILYNAGTDILDGDPLGMLSISHQGIIERDEIVFRLARKMDIPILMVTSGGYQKCTARVIADSILNLKAKGLLDIVHCEADMHAGAGGSSL
ncbi:histone deacetylase 11-like [Rhopilema esculentum]|uniref:histone deacetylase 11-like n=1 Tax=Rhopilema esculentum TaxID=499914 RepID=UPI0031D1F049|eukprot:gene230-9869_t